MVRRFDDGPDRPARGLQIWQILIGKAHNRQTITYGQLAELLGFEGAQVLAQPLGHVYYYCQQRKLPLLTAIVVKQDSGLPGHDLSGVDLNRSREDVFAFDWYGIWPPTPDELRAAYEQGRVVSPAVST
jgi:hypothetical protein